MNPDLRGLRCVNWCDGKPSLRPLVPFVSRSEYEPKRCVRLRSSRRIDPRSDVRSFHGICVPTTHEETGSDLHRVCLARLCCAFRFSQPLDALIPPASVRPCFMPLAPLGFRFQRIPPPGSRHASRRACPSCCSSRRRQGCAEPQLQGLMQPVGPFTMGGVTR